MTSSVAGGNISSQTREASSSISDLTTRTRHQYATGNVLQSCEIYVPHEARPTISEPTTQIWLIYIHGGAWRDPTITAHDSFAPTLSHLLATSPVPATDYSSSFSSEKRTDQLDIVGYASLSYRLSPHPSHPQDPLTTPEFELRQARHPDHIHDTLLALRHLQQTYEFGDRYILLGHSCGGTLAWQIVMSLSTQHHDQDIVVEPPTAIISVCGIYHLPLLVETFEHVPAYRELAASAFGSDEALWAEISPAASPDKLRGWCLGLDRRSPSTTSSSSNKKVAGEIKRLITLAHSPHDELIDSSQLESMKSALKSQLSVAPQQKQRHSSTMESEVESPQGHAVVAAHLQVETLTARHHDEVWQDGREMAMLVQTALAELRHLS